MERITSYAKRLNLGVIPELLSSLAEEAAEKELSYTSLSREDPGRGG
jgi:hypothetical protein